MMDFDNERSKLLMNMKDVITEMDIVHYFRYAISTYIVSFRLNVLRFSGLLCSFTSKSENFSKRLMPLQKNWFLNGGLKKPSYRILAHLTQFPIKSVSVLDNF